MIYSEVLNRVQGRSPKRVYDVIHDRARETTDPGSLGLDESRWRQTFPEGDGEKLKAGLYIFWWKGVADSLPSNTAHWIKGKRMGNNDPNQNDLGSAAAYFSNKPDGESVNRDTRKYLHYRGRWTFRPVDIEDEVYIPLYIGKSTTVFQRIEQHLRWSASFARTYPQQLKENKKDDLHVIPRYGTASQFSDHFHFLFRAEDDLGQAKKIGNVHLSVCFTDFADYESRFFYEDRLIGELRPPFNLDSER